MRALLILGLLAFASPAWATDFVCSARNDTAEGGMSIRLIMTSFGTVRSGSASWTPKNQSGQNHPQLIMEHPLLDLTRGFDPKAQPVVFHVVPIKPDLMARNATITLSVADGPSATIPWSTFAEVIAKAGAPARRPEGHIVSGWTPFSRRQAGVEAVMHAVDAGASSLTVRVVGDDQSALGQGVFDLKPEVRDQLLAGALSWAKQAAANMRTMCRRRS